jgi:hypothetical protein
MAQGVLMMRTHVVSFLASGVAAVIFGCGVAAAQQAPATGTDKWYSVATSDSEVAFVNTNSIKQVGTTIEVKVKENFTAPRPAAKAGKTYLSARTRYRVDCASRKIAMSKTEAFSGTDLQGDVVQKASRNDRNLIWMDAPPASVFFEIVTYTCRHPPQAAPAG